MTGRNAPRVTVLFGWAIVAAEKAQYGGLEVSELRRLRQLEDENGRLKRLILDHVLILNEAHLRRLLHGYLGYYNTARPHQSLDHNSPLPREVHPPELGRVVSVPQVGGLHHLYQRAA